MKRTGAWGQVKVNEKRVEFVLQAKRGEETMTALCKRFEISRPTGYKWLRRYEQCDDIAALGEKSRRPHRTPGRSSAELERRVVELRRERPDWGAPKLSWLLAQEGVELPSITVHRILKRHGLVEREKAQPARRRFERSAPNELWQIDFKGMPRSAKNWQPLTALDDHSRYVMGLWGLAGTSGTGVRGALEGLFRRVGIRKRFFSTTVRRGGARRRESG